MSARFALLALSAMLAACQHAPEPAPAPPASQPILASAPGVPAGPSCLAPIGPGMADPDVRDLQYRVFERGGLMVVSMLACVVSDRFPAVDSLSIEATVYDADWRWGRATTTIYTVGRQIIRLNPVVPSRPGQPRLIALLGAELIPQSRDVAIIPGALVRLFVRPCVGEDAEQCGNAPIQVIEFPPRTVLIRTP